MKKKNIITAIGIIALALLISCSPKKEISYEPPSGQSTPLESPMKKGTTCYVFENGAFVEGEVDKKPAPISGEENFYRAMYMQIRYPPEARQRGVQGTVLITVVVNEFGQLEDAEIKKRIGAGCDEEALKAVKRGFQVGHEPAMKDGKAVKVRYDVPVKFSLG